MSVERHRGTATVTSSTKGDTVAEGERTRPSDETRDAEAVDALTTSEADRLPTPEEVEAAERARVADDEAARAYKEALERGARQQGEGRIP